MATGGQQQTRGALVTREEQSEFDRLMAKSVKSVKYTPFGETDEIELTYGQVLSFISARTKSGKTASEADIIKFMMLCKARGLNPWVGDAYLVGYDATNGPEFSLITSVSALMKRAEANPAFDGIESGVVVSVDRVITERQGDLVLPGERLVGSWAKCYRKDRRVPFYDALNLATYDKGYSQWKKDQSGMIVKCAEASVLRKAFPSQLSALYISQEMAEKIYERTPATSEQATGAPTVSTDHVPRKITMDDLTGSKKTEQAQQNAAPATTATKTEPQATTAPKSQLATRQEATQGETVKAAPTTAKPAAKTDAKPKKTPAPEPVKQPEPEPVREPTAYETWRERIEAATSADDARALLSDASADDRLIAHDWHELVEIVSARWDADESGDGTDFSFE